MFENLASQASQDPAGFLAEVTESLAKLPSELWRTGNDGFAGIAAAVAGGTVTVRKAMTALRQLAHVEDDLAPGKREEASASLTLMAQTGYDRHVIAIVRGPLALVGQSHARGPD